MRQDITGSTGRMIAGALAMNLPAIKQYYDDNLNKDKKLVVTTNDEPTPIDCVEEMINKKACLLCTSNYQLSKNLNRLLKNNSLKKNLVKNAFEYSRVDKKIIKVIINNISPFLKAAKSA